MLKRQDQKNRASTIMIVFASAAILFGCGQKGPLTPVTTKKANESGAGKATPEKGKADTKKSQNL